MERFYIKDIHTLPDPKSEPSAMEGLPLTRKEKCLRFLKAEDRKRSLGAGLIILQIQKDFGCRSPLTFGENGKPEIEGVYFNVSHSGDYVIGLAADVPVGCDIEKMDSPPFGVAHRFFCQSEQDYLSKHTNPQFAFWQLWTLKESYMKMTGEGMRLPLDKFCVSIGESIQVYRETIRQDCVFTSFVHQGHAIAVCYGRRNENGEKENFID